MNEIIIAIGIAVIVIGILIIVQEVQKRKLIKENEEMKIEDFKKKFKELYDSKDGAKLAAFMARHAVFMIKHQNEVAEFMRALSNGEINKKE